MKFNINDYVKVKLTDHGREIHKQQYEQWFKDMPWYEYTPPQEDAEGWSKWQMWDLMQTFGAVLYNGCKLPFETEIEIEETNS